MKRREQEAVKYFLKAWKTNWDLNRYYRNWFDEDMEAYRGYRDQSETPYLYNLSFNKLLPRVMTVLSRMMEQLYQGGTDGLVSVRPRKRSDVDRAPRVAGLLNYQLENLNSVDQQGGSFLHNFMWLFNAVTFGKGISKLYWRKDERIMPRRVEIPIPQFEGNRLVGMSTAYQVINENQTIYDGPYAEVIHNKLFCPHPHYRDIDRMPFVGCLYRRSIDYIKRKEREGVFKNVRELGWSGTSSNTSYAQDSMEAFAKSLEIDGALELDIDKQIQENRTPEVDIIEGYGRYIFPEDEAPYEVGSGIKMKGTESEAVVHIGNYKTLLKLDKWSYGSRPFFAIGAYYHPELFWDLGLMRLGKDIQYQYDNMANLRHQNVMMLINQMLKVREGADIDPAALVWKAFGIVPVEYMDDVQPLEVGDAFQSNAFKQQEEFFDSVLSDLTGLYPYNMGATPTRQEYVGTMYSLQSMGEQRTKLLMMTMDHQGFRPFLKYMMLLNAWHLDPRTEARINTSQGTQFMPLFADDIHVDYDFSARYTAMEPALGKHFRAQQLIQYAQMWQQSPFLQHYQFMKAILELLDFHDSDRYLKTPQQVAQEMSMQTQQAVQMQMMGFQMQDQLAQNQSARELERDIVKGLLD